MRALLPLAWLYGAGVSIRNRYYDRRGGKRLPVPVLSVGNLTVGGSGKTPLVAAIAGDLLSREIPVAVVSRGYGRRGSAPFVLVSDGKRVLVDAGEGGDEPVELARQHPALVVAVGRDRHQVGQRLVERLGRRVILLDDGFQHRQLARDVDIVCLDGGETQTSLRLLPAGRLREPLESLKRADAVVLTRWNAASETPALGGVPVIRAANRVTGFTRLDAAEDLLPADAFRDQPIGLAAAIARPERVGESLDARIVHSVFRRDHHRWTQAEVAEIVDQARSRGARALLTTGKDAVKMTFREPGVLPVYRIDVETEILDLETLRKLLTFPAL